MADLLIPDIGENVSGGDVVRIMVAKGDTIKKDQAVIELETDKATIEVPSDQEGTVTEIKVKEGEKVKIGQVILTLDSAGAKTQDERPKTEEKPKALSSEPKEAQPEAKAEPEKVVDIASRAKAPAAKTKDESPKTQERPNAQPAGEDVSSGAGVGAAPSVRRMARELGVDISRVQGTGPGGRIGAEDVQSFVKSVMAGGGTGAGAGLTQAAPLPDFS
jgi:pyruvate dehydrogenase E2 component (dihydrolipoamide acetyltransferase)